jgi:hypothetical protein
MDGVDFNEQDEFQIRRKAAPVPWSARILLKWGIIEEASQAEIVLVSFALVCFAASGYLFYISAQIGADPEFPPDAFIGM